MSAAGDAGLVTMTFVGPIVLNGGAPAIIAATLIAVMVAVAVWVLWTTRR